MREVFETGASAKVQIMLSCGSIVDQELNNWECSDPWVARFEIIQADDITWIDSDDYSNGVHVYQVSASIIPEQIQNISGRDRDMRAGQYSQVRICADFLYQQDLASACIWNYYRMGRIQLNQTMIQLLNFAQIPDTEQLDLRRYNHYATIQRMIDDICASVPYTIGNRQALTGFEDIQYLHHSGETDFNAAKSELYWKAHGTLLAPLLTCLQVDSISDTQRLWINAQILRVNQILRRTAATEISGTATRLEDLSFLLFSRAVDVR